MGAGDSSGGDRELWICELGVVPYREATMLQEDIAEARRAGDVPDVLLMLEHPSVYTRGRRAEDAELGSGAGAGRALGIEVVETNRGGRITYHGPGQLVGYAIMRIDDVGAHLRAIEAALIGALEREGIAARSRCAEGPDYTGVWVADRKIASIGVHVSRGVTTHGFALNVDMDLSPFEAVIACGLPGVEMTSVARELPAGRPLDHGALRSSVAARFCEAHGRAGNRVPLDSVLGSRAVPA